MSGFFVLFCFVFCGRLSQRLIAINKDLISFPFKLLIYVTGQVQTWALTW